MSRTILMTAVQASLLGAFSNFLAQLLATMQTAAKPGISSPTFDPAPLCQFAVYNFLTTPLNYFWQKYLENSFPGNTKKPAKSSTELSPVKNTLIKFILDQTLGAGVNTTLFITIMGGFKGLEWPEIEMELRNNLWPMVLASYSLWPFVTIFNLIVVPFEYRILVGNLAGIAWSVYLSLAAI